MLYDNLPGIELTIQDKGLILPAEQAATSQILIIAPVTKTGSDTDTYASADYNPIRISGQGDFETNGLGVYNIDNPMARLWKQAFDAGCRDIQAIPLKGASAAKRYGFLHDIFYILEENISADIVLVGGIYADDAVDTSVTFTYDRNDYAGPIALANNLVTEVTTPEVVGTGDATIKIFNLDNKPVVAGTLILTSDATQVPVADYTVDYKTGTITFAVAPAVDADITAVYEYYSYDFAAQLAGFCETVTAKNTQLLGILALKPAISNDLADIKTYIDGQKTQKYSKYLQVVGGSTMWFSLGSSVYEDVWLGAYAGLISVLPSYSSPMFKAIPGALFASYNLSPNQILSLINKHIVVPRVRNGRIIIADAITTSPDDSDFVRLSTVRIVNDVVNVVRDITEPYIGEPNTLVQRNAMDTAIRTSLTGMINRGALNDFRFHIQSTIADQIDGTLRILLDIVPVFETRRILMSLSLKPMLDQ